jgi:esterase/lipase superfamily enzyme
MFLKSRWYSSRIGTEATLARWGAVGQPVLVFPTAGGDAEEIERMHLVRVLGPLIDAGRIKVYSCDSVGGRVWFNQIGSTDYRMAMQDAFQQWVRHEVVPAIHMDCRSTDLPIWAAGASIGAFHAAAVVCRFPDVFHKALCMSGTYNLMRFIEAPQPTDAFRAASPLYFVPHLKGRHLEILRTRHLHIATGAGKYENVGESWGLANVLGAQGVPNYMDNWGPDWHHDWVTWREMVPRFLDEWTR